MKNLKEHAKDITNLTFKGTKLVQEWLMTGRVDEKDKHGKPIDTWIAREMFNTLQVWQKYL